MHLLLCILFSIFSLYSTYNVSYVTANKSLYDPSASTSISAFYRVNPTSIGFKNLQQTQHYYIRWPGIRRKRIALGCFKGSKISYYSNSTATFRTRLLLLFDTEVNPGSDQLLTSQRKLKCLYLNSRSLVNKAKYLEAMESSNEHDLIAVTETWLNPSVRDSELLINIHFNVHRRDRESGERGGGVMLAVRHHLNSTRRSDVETDAELLACEIIPNDRKKFLCLVFYRPPLSGIYCREGP